MLKRLPPRLLVFIDGILYAAIGILAVHGLVAMYRDSTEMPAWHIMLALAVGTAIRAFGRKLPKRALGVDLSGHAAND